VRGDARLSGLSLQVRGGLDERDVLLHFVNAERLTLTSVGLEAAVMAPQAEVWLESASLRGTLIASSLSGSGSLEPAAFRGSLPCG
jgi:choice-of-anchor A domain-containing protein